MKTTTTIKSAIYPTAYYRFDPTAGTTPLEAFHLTACNFAEHWCKSRGSARDTLDTLVVFTPPGPDILMGCQISEGNVDFPDRVKDLAEHSDTDHIGLAFAAEGCWQEVGAPPLAHQKKNQHVVILSIDRAGNYLANAITISDDASGISISDGPVGELQSDVHCSVMSYVLGLTPDY